MKQLNGTVQIYKKVLYLGGFELPDGNAAAHRVINNSRCLKDLGYKVDLIGLSRRKFNNVFSVDGFDCLNQKYPLSNFDFLKYLTNPNYFLDMRVILEYDIVILYNFPSISMKKIINFCKKNNVLVFSDVTEWYSAKSGKLYKRIAKFFDTEYRMKVLNKRTDGIISISNYLYSYYKNKKIENCVIVPPLVDCNQFEKYKRSNNDDIIRFVYAGTTSGREKDDLEKSILWLIENITDTKKIELNIIGIEKDDFIIMYGDSILKKINFKINFHKRKTHDETLQFIKNCDFTIFFRSENRVNKAGFPTKFVEAHTLGLKIITSFNENYLPYKLDIININEKQSDLMIFNKRDFLTINTTFDYNNYTNVFSKLVNFRKEKKK